MRSTRVLIQTDDSEGSWSTVGVDENVIVASWLAIVDAVDYGLTRAGVAPPEAVAAPTPRPTSPGKASAHEDRASSTRAWVSYGVVEGTEVLVAVGTLFGMTGQALDHSLGRGRRPRCGASAGRR